MGFCLIWLFIIYFLRLIFDILAFIFLFFSCLIIKSINWIAAVLYYIQNIWFLICFSILGFSSIYFILYFFTFLNFFNFIISTINRVSLGFLSMNVYIIFSAFFGRYWTCAVHCFCGLYALRLFRLLLAFLSPICWTLILLWINWIFFLWYFLFNFVIAPWLIIF